MSHEAFLQTIYSHPEEDTPRLVYADYLEEQGETDRAELIRLQMEQTHTPEWEPKWDLLDRRIDRLIDRLAIPIPEPLTPILAEISWRRGFPQAILIEFQTFLDHWKQLFEHFPLINECRFLNAEQVTDAMRLNPTKIPMKRVDLSQFQLDHLYSSNSLSHHRFVGLQSLNLRGQNRLHLSYSDVTRWFDIKELKQLNLSEMDMDDQRINQFLGSSTPAATLEDLRLSASPDSIYSVRLRASGARTLALSPHLNKLKRLNLDDQMIGDAGLTYLSESSNFQQVEILDLANNDLGNIGISGIEALVRSSSFTNVRSLNLSGNHLGDWATRELVKWRNLQQIRRLDLSGNHLKREAFTYILDYPDWHPEVRINLILNKQARPDLVKALIDRFEDRVMIDGAY